MKDFVQILALAMLVYIAATSLRMYKQNLLEMVSGLVNRAEEAIQGSGMGAEKKAIVIAQLEAAGIRLFLLSNSRKPGRAKNFAEKLGIPYQGHSGKPKRAGYRRAMERMGAAPEETVMVGDQIFTDTLGANNAGVVPLLVEPIRLAGNPGRYVRYAAEAPFRLLGRSAPIL